MQIREVAEIRSGSVVPRIGEADAAYVRPGDLSSGSLSQRPFLIAPRPERSFDDALLQADDILVSLRGTTNAAIVVRFEDIGALPLFGTLDIAIIRLRTSAIAPGYLATILNLPETQMTLGGERSGSAAPRLPLPALGNIDIPVPDRARQDAIVRLAEAAALERTLFKELEETRTRFFNALLAKAARGAHAVR